MICEALRSRMTALSGVETQLLDMQKTRNDMEEVRGKNGVNANSRNAVICVPAAW
jgi:hypothetical protein